MTGPGIPEVSGLKSRLAVWLFHRFFMLRRGMTLGVRAACFDREGRIFMVRHTYVPGWYLPGGGVERHETVLQALEKELREEGNLVMTAAPQLFHVYYNRLVSKRDHVLFYRVEVEQTAPRPPDREIAESGFFALDDLPKDVTSATLRRIRELTGQEPPSDMW
ncbi:NUDIX domain-containing protein [Pseudorhizobium endolithicum]|uniref:NUDIX domain-containing protein n=1 Tax=Pseudorhizobium endolithicum TaxID=1191678 RepID=A0ABN7JDA6_9HYPH|nr:NUDIX domain-containing protein [Pseudorhizobium endolithicum]CAD6410138.1 NUDIX domain-containing protein [Rhizobium sp. Q54]CAD7024350.1 NUDIX domain-containing protein [Pseudorhizobium endolithicum]